MSSSKYTRLKAQAQQDEREAPAGEGPVSPGPAQSTVGVELRTLSRAANNAGPSGPPLDAERDDRPGSRMSVRSKSTTSSRASGAHLNPDRDPYDDALSQGSPHPRASDARGVPAAASATSGLSQPGFVRPRPESTRASAGGTPGEGAGRGPVPQYLKPVAVAASSSQELPLSSNVDLRHSSVDEGALRGPQSQPSGTLGTRGVPTGGTQAQPLQGASLVDRESPEHREWGLRQPESPVLPGGELAVLGGAAANAAVEDSEEITDSEAAQRRTWPQPWATALGPGPPLDDSISSTSASVGGESQPSFSAMSGASSTRPMFGPGSEPSALTYFEPVFRRAHRYGPLVAGGRRCGAWVLLGLAGLCLLGVTLAVVFGVVKRGNGSAAEGIEDATPSVPSACVNQVIKVPLLGNMSLVEKVGQLMMVDRRALDSLDDIRTYKIGAILRAAGEVGDEGNTPADWAWDLDQCQARALGTHLGIPLVFAANAVHGHASVYGTTVFPHHSALGATRNPALVAEIAGAAAMEVAGTGVRWTMAPSASLCKDPRWGRCYETFAERETVVSPLVLAEVNGWQALPLNGTQNWTELATESGYTAGDEGTTPVFVAATAKQYLGDGAATKGRDGADVQVSNDFMRTQHLPPFSKAVGADVAAIMLTKGTFLGNPIAGNSSWVDEKLRGELGFRGLVVAELAAIEKIPGNFTQKVLLALQAGVDVFVLPQKVREFQAAVISLARKKAVSLHTIHRSVARVLALKEGLDLFQIPCAQTEIQRFIGIPYHRSLAREAVAQSLVLLKNQLTTGPGRAAPRYAPGSPLVPLRPQPGQTVLVVGAHANDLGLQCGGWTITQQGRRGNVTRGTTILEGLQEVAGQGVNLVYTEKFDYAAQADVGIVVVGEEPYALAKGYSATLELNAMATAGIQGVCQSMPCLVVLVSGRPVSISKILPVVDALVVAWLPGSEGAGVADVLLGEREFQGRLPFSWFESVDKLPDVPLQTVPEPLFKMGFGMFKNGTVVEGDPLPPNGGSPTA